MHMLNAQTWRNNLYSTQTIAYYKKCNMYIINRYTKKLQPPQEAKMLRGKQQSMDLYEY